MLGFKWEPALISEALRQIILACILFQLLNWSDQQVAGFLMAVSAIFALFTRQTVVSQGTLNQAGLTLNEVKRRADDVTVLPVTEQGNTPTPKVPVWLLPLFIAGALVATPACGKRYAPNVPVQTKIAYEMDQALAQIESVQVKIIAQVDANPSIKPTADKVLVPIRELAMFVKARALPVLRAYDAAVTVAAREGLKGDITKVLTEFNDLLTKAFNVNIPDGVLSNAAKFAESVRSLFVTTRTEFQLGW